MSFEPDNQDLRPKTMKLKYIVSPDTSARANCTRADGNKVRVLAVSDSITVAMSAPAGSQVVATLDGLTPIPYTPDQAKQFAAAKATTLAAIQSAYDQALSGGIVVQVPGAAAGATGLPVPAASSSSSVTLAASEADQNIFARQMTLLATIESGLSATSQATFEASTQTIADMHGTPHVLTVTALRALIESYGQQIAALWSAMATRRAAALAATTFEQLAGV